MTMRRKNNVLKLFSLVLLAVAFASCQSGVGAQAYLIEFEAFIEGVESNVDTYSQTDWERNDAEFSKFMGSKFEKVKDKLTSEEKKKVGELTARYYKAKMKSAGKSLKGKIIEWKDYIEGFTEEVKESLEELKDIKLFDFDE